MKTCIGCKFEKSENEFNWRSKTKGQRTARCTLCIKEYNKKWHEEKGQSRREQIYAWREFNWDNNRKKLAEYFLAHPCIDCGESDLEVLELDHRDASLKSYGVASKMQSTTWDNLLIEIEKCDVRCANCHKRRTNRQFGFWRYNASLAHLV